MGSRCPTILSNTSKNFNLVSQKWLLAAETNTLSELRVTVRVSYVCVVPWGCRTCVQWRWFVKFAAVLPKRRTPRWTYSSLAEEFWLVPVKFLDQIIPISFLSCKDGFRHAFSHKLRYWHIISDTASVCWSSSVPSMRHYSTHLCTPFGSYGCFPPPLLNSLASHWVEWIHSTAKETSVHLLLFSAMQHILSIRTKIFS